MYGLQMFIFQFIDLWKWNFNFKRFIDYCLQQINNRKIYVWICIGMRLVYSSTTERPEHYCIHTKQILKFRRCGAFGQLELKRGKHQDTREHRKRDENAQRSIHQTIREPQWHFLLRYTAGQFGRNEIKKKSANRPKNHIEGKSNVYKKQQHQPIR